MHDFARMAYHQDMLDRLETGNTKSVLYAMNKTYHKLWKNYHERKFIKMALDELLPFCEEIQDGEL